MSTAHSLAVSNDDPIPDRGPAVFAVTTGTLVLATLFVISRLICRIGIVKRISWDDYFIIVAWFLAFGLSTTIDIGTSKGLGRHDANISEDDRLPLRKSEYVFSVLYNPALMAIKTSILVFYLRLSRNTQQVLRVASWVVLGIVNVAGTVLTLMNIFQCRPVQAAFELTSYHAQCIPLLTEFICSAPVNIVTDLAILALPIPVLTGMRLPSRQKYILVFTFSLGIFVTIVDVVRIYYLQQAITNVPTGFSSDSDALFGDSSEFSWNASLSLMWSAVEVNVGMTCACIPTLKPLIVKILPSMLVDPDSPNTYGSDTQYGTSASDKEAVGLPQDSTELPKSPNGTLVGVQAPALAHRHESEDITAIDFLTTPDMLIPASPTTGQNQLLPQRTKPNGPARNSVYFGFVNMTKPKSMIKTSPAESFKYCTVVTVLFLLWGFSYGLLNTLNNVIAAVGNMSLAETLGLTSIYFGAGYFFGPLIVGEWVLRHDEHARFHRSQGRHKHPEPVGGFKATFIIGLCIYGIGTITFWPSAVLNSFAGFMISNFVVGFGLGVLETAANPFIILCGPRQFAETRILLSQGVQGIGTVISGLLAQKVFFVNIGTGDGQSLSSLELIDVQWTYLAITLFCVALALFFYYMPLPEVTDAELGRAADKLPVKSTKRSFGGFQLRTWCIILAVMAQWTYVACQESMSIFFRSLITAPLLAGSGASSTTSALADSLDQPPGLDLSIPDYLIIAHSAFAISRFNAAHIAWLSVRFPTSRYIPTPRTMLTAFCALTVVFAILCVVLRPLDNPNLLVVPAVLFFFCEGPLWPLIFAMGLRGQGKRTKRAAVWLTMGGSGPAFWPFVMYAITKNGGSVQISFIVVVVLCVLTLFYPVFLTVVGDARDLVDPVFRGRLVGAGGGMGGGENPESGLSTREQSVDMNEIMRQRRKRASSNTTAQAAKGGAVKSMMGRLSDNISGKKRDRRKASSSSSYPVFEHRERSSVGEEGEDGKPSHNTIPEER